MKETVSVKEAEALLVRAKEWEAARNRLLKAAEEVERHGYTVKIFIEPIADEE